MGRSHVKIRTVINMSTHGALVLGVVFSGAHAMGQAKDALSTHLGVCAAELPRRTKTASDVRRSGSKHVYVKAAGYEVRMNGEYKGQYRTDAEAVSAVAQEVGQPKKALRRSRAAGEPRSLGIRRFRVLKRIFKDGNGGSVHRGGGVSGTTMDG